VNAVSARRALPDKKEKPIPKFFTGFSTKSKLFSDVPPLESFAQREKSGIVKSPAKSNSWHGLLPGKEPAKSMHSLLPGKGQGRQWM
jgi:hypothetical protein